MTNVMTINPNLASALLVIATAKHNYEGETGLVPNLLLVGANAYDGFTTGEVIYGMRVLVDDSLKQDYAVAYVL